MSASAAVRQAIERGKVLAARAAACVSAFVSGPGARKRLLASAAAAAGAVVFAAAFLGAGYWAAEHDVPEKLERRYFQPAAQAAARTLGVESDTTTIAWDGRTTNRQDFQIARFRVERNRYPQAWTLAPAGDNLVIGSRHGQISYFNLTSNRLGSVELNVPMRLAELLESDVITTPGFEFGDVRTFDLLAVPTGPERFDLYASHARFSGDCFDLAVSRTPLLSTPEGVTAETGEWEQVYAMNPCLPFKTTGGMLFAGHEGGGRLILKDADTLLLSVGVFQYDNVAMGQLAGQDPTIDLGKIIAITLSTGEGRIYAQGFRNPQGLLLASDGVLWETEHGPQGGDEINRIIEGGNYGWPLATYGMDYGSPPRHWPFSHHPGSHEGFDEPEYVFTPSVGISNIIEPDAEEFPGWSGDLVAASLVGEHLFAVHVSDHKVVSAEPVEIGGRLRDIVSLSDGRLALSTDSGELILLRGPDHEDESFVLSGLMAVPDPLPELVPRGSPTREDIGGQRFQYACRTCHSLDGEIGIGPPLNGLFQRPIASIEGYGYSEALQSHDEVWTPDLLRSFLMEPQRRFAGTIMPTVDAPEESLEELIAYLRTTELTPASR